MSFQKLNFSTRSMCGINGPCFIVTETMSVAAKKQLRVGGFLMFTDETHWRLNLPVLLIDTNRLTCRLMPLIPFTYPPPPSLPGPQPTWHCQHPWAMNECPWWTMNTNMTLRDLNAYPRLISVARNTSCAFSISADTLESRKPTPTCQFNNLVANCYFPTPSIAFCLL